TGARIASSAGRLEGIGAQVVERVEAATPLIDELRQLGADATGLEQNLAQQQASDGEDRVLPALAFIREATRQARAHRGADGHLAMLVQQRLSRLHGARDAYVTARLECEGLSQGLPGRWALAFGVTSPACHPRGK
ncbi:MAG: hypothetical protein AAF602_25355, partial [Myxococcota bacterium]